MKKSILLLPLLALNLILGSCNSDSDYPDRPTPQIDVDEITENVNNAISEALANSNFNDTIFNCDDDSTMMVITSNGISSKVTSPSRIPDVKVSITNNDNGWVELQKEKNYRRTIVALVWVIVPCIMIVTIAALLLMFFYARLRNRNKVIEKAIEANYQLPVEFYTNGANNTTINQQPSDIKSTPQQDGLMPPPIPRDERLRVHGLRLVAIGLGLIIMLGVWGGIEAAVIGVIPMLIGASNLANYYNILK